MLYRRRRLLLLAQASPDHNLQTLLTALYGNGEQGAFYVPKPQVLGQQVLFQDTAGTTPVTASGDPVGLLLDLSGNDNHATQEVSGSRPVYRTDGQYHWLEFDGVDDALVLEGTSAWTEFSPASSSGFYIGLATEKLDTGFGVQLAKGSGTTENSFQLASRIENNTVYWRLSGRASAAGYGPVSTADLQDAVVFDVDWDGTYALGKIGSFTREQVGFGEFTDTTYNISIGARAGGTDANVNARFFGIVMAEKSLRGSDLYQTTRLYLANLAGVTLND